jgi:hypothetical protein
VSNDIVNKSMALHPKVSMQFNFDSNFSVFDGEVKQVVLDNIIMEEFQVSSSSSESSLPDHKTMDK